MYDERAWLKSFAQQLGTGEHDGQLAEILMLISGRLMLIQRKNPMAVLPSKPMRPVYKAVSKAQSVRAAKKAARPIPWAFEEDDDPNEYWTFDELNGMTIGRLRRIADDYHLPFSGLTKAELVDRILHDEADVTHAGTTKRPMKRAANPKAAHAKARAMKRPAAQIKHLTIPGKTVEVERPEQSEPTEPQAN